MNNKDGKTNGHGFYLVDFAARYQKGFRNNIVTLRQVPGLIGKYREYECYATYFLYTEDLRLHVKRNENSSVSGYHGLVYANYLPIDIDASDLKVAQQTAVLLVKFLLEFYGLSDKEVLVYFSGSRGFHIMVDVRAFGGIEPSRELHVVFSRMRERMVEAAKADRNVIDLCIKDKLRLWRLPNTINQKSGLFKIQLTIDELFRLTPSQIKDKARKPQAIFLTDRTGLLPLEKDIKTSKKMQELYNEIQEGMKNLSIKTIQLEKQRKVTGQSVIGAFCQAEQAIAKSRVQEGLRNNAALRLVSRLREKGFSPKEAWEFIREWNTKCGVRLPGNELASIVRSVYSRKRGYRYGCNDEILKRFCPFKRRIDCRDYRLFQIKTIAE